MTMDDCRDRPAEVIAYIAELELQTEYEQYRSYGNVVMADMRIKELEQWQQDHVESDRTAIAALLAHKLRITELEQALKRIIHEADEYDGSPANELVDIARTALGRG